MQHATLDISQTEVATCSLTGSSSRTESQRDPRHQSNGSRDRYEQREAVVVVVAAEGSLALDFIAEVSAHLLPPEEVNEKYFRLLLSVVEHLRLQGVERRCGLR